MSTDKVVILGAGGLLGSGFAKALGERAVLLDHRDLDLCDAAAFEGVLREHGPGLVINAAGLSQGTKEELYRINGLCAARAAESCSAAKAAFVFISSSRVFGTCPDQVRVEDAEPCPADDYGWSKFKGEELVRGSGDHYVVRLPMVLGFRRHRTETQIINRLIEHGRQGLPVQVSYDVLHSPLHVSQAVNAVLALADPMTGKAGKSGTYHVTGADEVTLKDMVQRIFSGLGIGVGVEGVDASRFEANPLLNLTLASSKLAPAGDWKGAADLLVAEYIQASTRPVI